MAVEENDEHVGGIKSLSTLFTVTHSFLPVVITLFFSLCYPLHQGLPCILLVLYLSYFSFFITPIILILFHHSFRLTFISSSMITVVISSIGDGNDHSNEKCFDCNHFPSFFPFSSSKIDMREKIMSKLQNCQLNQICLNSCLFFWSFAELLC